MSMVEAKTIIPLSFFLSFFLLKTSSLSGLWMSPTGGVTFNPAIKHLAYRVKRNYSSGNCSLEQIYYE